MTPLAFVAAALAAWRAATFVTADKLTAPLRARLARRYRPLRAGGGPRPVAVLSHCTRCLSVWTSGLVVGAMWAVGMVDGPAWFVLGWAGTAGAAAVLADRVA